jgi:aconitate decarboxylase
MTQNPSETHKDDPPGVTAELCQWIHSLKLEDIPKAVRTRAKYLILDGLACGLTGARVPWSEHAAKAIWSLSLREDIRLSAVKR